MSSQHTLTIPEAEFKEQYEKVLELFFSFPNKEFSLNDIVEEAQISKTTANDVITTLINEQFLQRTILGRTWRITVNNDHVYTLSRKIPWTLRKIYESEILDIIIEHVPEAKNVILFGSYRKGQDTQESDIDIAVEVDGNNPLEIETIAVFKELAHRKNVPVQLHIFSRNNIDLNVFNNIANGIVLWGFLEVRT